MKEKVVFFLKNMFLVCILFFACVGVYRAENANSDSGGGVSSSTGGNCTSGWLCAVQYDHQIKVRLVYYDADTGKETVKAGPTLVNAGNLNWGGKTTAHSWYTVGEKWEFYADNFEMDTVGSNKNSRDQKRTQLKSFIKSMGWSVDIDGLTEPSCEVLLDKPGNCYGKSGYRVIAELSLGFAEGAGRGRANSFLPVKNLGNKSGVVNPYNTDKNTQRVKDMSNDMTIRWADINYTCYKGKNKSKTAVYDSCIPADSDGQESIDCLKNKNCGYGIWIVDISSALKKYDYSLDAACEDCKSTNSDSKAIVIQDTTNWEAIANSDTAGCKEETRSYYYKETTNKKTYCREEYHVYYPNANNKIKVQVGRFFTVNASKDELDLIDGSIPNFAPIRVKRIRQCKSKDATALNNFKDNSDSAFKNCGGGIEINYSDKKNYKYKGYAKQKLISFSSNIENGVLTQRADFDYTLEKGVYQYIRIADGYSIKTAPSDANDNTVYKDLKVSNLPISFAAADKIKPSVTLTYNLPNSNKGKVCEDSTSKMYLAYKDKNNNYLTCSDFDTNVYVKETEQEKLADTACAKLYNSTTSEKFKKCQEVRASKSNKFNKLGDCIDKDYICNLPVDNITCDETHAGKKNDNPDDGPVYDYSDYTWDTETQSCVLYCVKRDGKYYGKDGKETTKENYGKDCCNADNHEEFGRDWAPEKDGNPGYCCEEGTSYAEADGICCDPKYIDPISKMCFGKPGDPLVPPIENYDDCDMYTYEELGRDWNKNEGTCCPEGYKYNETTKRCEPGNNDKVNGCDKDHLNCGDKPCCKDDEGHLFCGYRVNGVDICPGKPDVNVENSVYRTINPSDPFILQNGTQREAGTNWCSYDVTNQKLNCSTDSTQNNVIDAVIKKANTSEENALYVVELDTETINKIRDDNNKNGYDSFDMVCEGNGEGCKSNFIHTTIADHVSGKCAGISGVNDFYGCANTTGTN